MKTKLRQVHSDIVVWRTHVLEGFTSSTLRSKGCRVGVAVEVVEDVFFSQLLWIQLRLQVSYHVDRQRLSTSMNRTNHLTAPEPT